MTPASAPLPLAIRRLAWSNLAAQCAEQVALAAAPLMAVLLLHAGPAQTAWLQTAQTLPFLILSLPAGVLTDRGSPRRVMLAAEAVRAASLVALLVMLLAGQASLAALAALGFAGAVGTVAYGVAAPALVPGLVGVQGLSAANRRLELARSAAFAAGPALGGALVGWTGPAAAYVGAAGLSVLAVALLARLPHATQAAGPRRRMGQDLRAGAAFVFGHALLRPVLLTAVVFNTAWFVLQSVYVAYAVEHLGLGPVAVGLTLAAYGAGMVLGALAAPWIDRRMSFGRMILVGPLAGLAAALAMAATQAVPSGALAGLSLALFGAGPILWTIATTTLRQAVTPAGMLGRVSAVLVTATTGSRPIGAAIGGMLATHAGAGACLDVAALGFALQALLLATSAVPQLRHQPGLG